MHEKPGAVQLMIRAASRPAPPRLWAVCDIFSKVFFWVFLLLLLAVGSGLIGNVPEHDRIPVAAMFHAFVDWINE